MDALSVEGLTTPVEPVVRDGTVIECVCDPFVSVDTVVFPANTAIPDELPEDDLVVIPWV